MSILLVYLCNLGRTDLICSACDLNVLKSSAENPQVQGETQAIESCSLGRTALNCSACDLDFVKSSRKIHKYKENLKHSSLAL